MDIEVLQILDRINDLKCKRAELLSIIERRKKQKERINKEIRLLNSELRKINEEIKFWRNQLKGLVR